MLKAQQNSTGQGQAEMGGDLTSLPSAQFLQDDVLVEYGDVNDEYETQVVQYGFVTLFACAFPLGPFFAFIHNYLEIRSDAYKLLVEHKRVLPLQAQDIGNSAVILRLRL